MASKRISATGIVQAGRDKLLSFWQSDAFFTLTRENGRLVEKRVGASKPTETLFIKGGRRRAEDAAAELWGKLAKAKAKDTGELDSEVHDDEPRSGKLEEPVGEPLEPHEDVEISPKPTRIEQARGSFSGMGAHAPRLTPKMPKLG